MRLDGEQLLLGLYLGIARQQDPNSMTLRPQDQRRIVGIGPSATKRMRRPEHLESDVSHLQPQTHRRRLSL
jgi:hypothetical protein